MKPLQTPAALRATVAAARVAARFSEHLAGLVSARLWFTPWPVAVSERARAKQAQWLEGSERLSFKTRSGHRLKGFTAGAGPTVLLVHGWGEWAANLGGFIAPLVDAGFHVAAFDLPAHGASSGTQTDALVNAEAVRDAASYVGDVRAVVAHSMGGHVTTVALHRGLEVEAIVLLAPVVRLYSVDVFKQLFGLPDAAARGLRATIERRYGNSVWTDLAADRIARDLRVPALIFHDTEDAQIAADDVRALAAAWSGSHVTVTTGLGHGRIIRDRGVITRSVEFISSSVLKGSSVLASELPRSSARGEAAQWTRT